MQVIIDENGVVIGTEEETVTVTKTYIKEQLIAERDAIDAMIIRSGLVTAEQQARVDELDEKIDIIDAEIEAGRADDQRPVQVPNEEPLEP